MTNQIKTKDSFIIYRSFIDAISSLPDAERLQIFDAISYYALDGKEPNLSGISHTVFTLIKPQLDANRKRFENGCREKKKSKKEAKSKQKRSKREANHNVNDNPNPNQNEESQFESFWNMYDKKKSRPDAEKKFKIALKKDTFENIMAGVEKYIKTRGTDAQFWKHPSTWLNQECWKDEYSNSARKSEVAEDSFCQSLNQLLGQDLIKSLIEGDLITIKLTSASANDKWDLLGSNLKESVLAKVKAKFGKNIKISF